MVDPRSARRLGHYAIFAAIAALTTFLRLLPVNQAPGRIPGPDLMVAFTFVWLMRRPDYVPALLIVDPKTDKVVNAGRETALADARSLSPQGLADWLAQWV